MQLDRIKQLLVQAKVMTPEEAEDLNDVDADEVGPFLAFIELVEADARGMPEDQNTRVWSCKIGVVGTLPLPDGADAPMREYARKGFLELTGRHDFFLFSGWGGKLDRHELEIAKEKAT